MNRQVIALAGPTGDLGERILKALVSRGADVRALVRTEASEQVTDRIAALGATVARTDPADVASMAAAVEGAACVVSALNGLREVIVDRQTTLLDAAVRAGVPRFIPSDYAADFTRTTPGRNRNFDLRRDLMSRADAAKIQVTSILNGAFLELLGAEMPIIQPRIHRVIFWRSADQLLDFTSKDDVAAYTAAAALDPATPRFLRIAGDSVSARDIARMMSDVTGERYRTLRVGGMRSLGWMIGLTKLLAPQPRATFPPWQGMQYTRDMFSGDAKLAPLDNDHYPEVRWTTVRDHLGRRPWEAREAGPAPAAR